MEAKELRIGSWVQPEHGKSNYQITAKDILDISQGRFPIEPIPLTEEWLIKFGFKQWGDKYTFGLKGINIHHRQRGFVLRKSVPVIQYVHQLQNLYFALTGEELTLK